MKLKKIMPILLVSTVLLTTLSFSAAPGEQIALDSNLEYYSDNMTLISSDTYKDPLGKNYKSDLYEDEYGILYRVSYCTELNHGSLVVKPSTASDEFNSDDISYSFSPEEAVNMTPEQRFELLLLTEEEWQLYLEEQAAVIQ